MRKLSKPTFKEWLTIGVVVYLLVGFFMVFWLVDKSCHLPPKRKLMVPAISQVSNEKPE